MPGLLALIEGSLPSGRYRASELAAARGERARPRLRRARGARAAGGARVGPRRRRHARRQPDRRLARPRPLPRAADVSSMPGDLLVVNTSATLPAALPARLGSRALELHLSTPRGRPELGGRAANRRPAALQAPADRHAARTPRRSARRARRPPTSGAQRLGVARLDAGEPVERYLAPARSPDPLRRTSGTMAARRLPDGVRARARQRRDAERRPAVHRRARHRARRPRRRCSRRSHCTPASPRPSPARRPTPSATGSRPPPPGSSTPCTPGAAA